VSYIEDGVAGVLVNREANKERVQTLIDQVFNQGRTDRLPEFFSGGTQAEAAGLHELLTQAFPDLRVRIDDLIAEDDKVVARLTFEGTHQGPFRDFEPTGRPVSFGAIRIYQLAGGRVTASWAYQDSLGLVQQLRG
jgi:predicted ester cyclase